MQGTQVCKLGINNLPTSISLYRTVLVSPCKCERISNLSFEDAGLLFPKKSAAHNARSHSEKDESWKATNKAKLSRKAWRFEGKLGSGLSVV